MTSESSNFLLIEDVRQPTTSRIMLKNIGTGKKNTCLSWKSKGWIQS